MYCTCIIYCDIKGQYHLHHEALSLGDQIVAHTASPPQLVY